MLSKSEALDILEGAVPRPVDFEEVPLASCLGRVLARDVTSDVDMPPFNRSAMDGYAVRAGDLGDAPVVLDVLEVIPAGCVGAKSVSQGRCSKIMTGAPVPDGADAVVMVEWTKTVGEDKVEISRSVEVGTNIAPRAQDMAVGEVVLRSGTPVRAMEVGILASVGCSEVLVWRRPSVAVIATGDELVAPSAGVPGPAQIRETNGEMLAAQVNSLGLGIESSFLGIARDDEASLSEMLESALEHEVTILSGGVSMGDYDIVHTHLKDRGLKVEIEKVAIKPGKPLLFGTLETEGGGTRYIFGLPGNPVSSFCTFELFVRPFLRGLMGCSGPHVVTVAGTLSTSMGGRAIPRTQHVPARVLNTGDHVNVEPVSWHGSGDLRGMLDANAFIIVPANQEIPAPGDTVEVMLFEPDVFRLPPYRSRESG